MTDTMTAQTPAAPPALTSDTPSTAPSGPGEPAALTAPAQTPAPTLAELRAAVDLASAAVQDAIRELDVASSRLNRAQMKQ